MNEIIQFRRENYGLFLDYADGLIQQVGVPASGANLLIDLPDQSGGILGGALSANVFSTFSLGISAQGKLEISVVYAKTRKIPLGYVEFGQSMEAIQWCIEATGMLEVRKTQNSSTLPSAKLERKIPSVDEFWGLCHEGYFQRSTERWLSDRTSADDDWSGMFRPLSERKNSKDELEVAYLFGIGSAYSRLLAALNVKTIRQLASWYPMHLTENLFELVRDEDKFPRAPHYQNVISWVYQAKIISVVSKEHSGHLKRRDRLSFAES